MQKTLKINDVDFTVHDNPLIVISDYPLIEDVLGREMADVIYANWNPAWGALIDYGGGEFGIDVAMMQEVTVMQIASMPGVGSINAHLVKDACRRKFEEQPYS